MRSKTYVDRKKMKEILKERKTEGYKGDYGHTLVLAGSLGYAGAAYFASQGAVKAGSGLVTLSVYEEIHEIMSIKLNEVMVKIKKNNSEYSKYTSVVFGSGLGKTKRTEESLDEILKLKIPLVLDADGLNVLEGKVEKLLKREGETVLTPHYGEFSRLLGISVERIKKNPVKIARDFAKKYEVILILKDHRTIITDGKNIYINTTGNSAMACGGAGDVLAGIIGGFISQGYTPLESALIGCYIHGESGDVLGKKQFVVTPSEILNEISRRVKSILKIK